ncbi:MAG TPA: asparagine synthase (glutamine-hydrolyzing) [Steroidobacteraceae bacterium]|nr:asparagine synthase (glutamine-hydrolyzing) [Steroidobacteraceae bacterium]
MCGITGFLRPSGFARADAEHWAQRMSACLVHRGPDDGGAWLDERAGVALAQRRLAIIDLSPAGKQPMSSVSGRYVMVYNGETYNHLEIRAELEAVRAAPTWRGHSDTETLLAAIEHWGLEQALRRVSGMFALALWDRSQHELSLARDRLGEKPLYFGWQGDCLLFGSELKALRAHPQFAAPVDRDALAELLRYGYIAAPASIYRGIGKLMPGSVVSFPANSAAGAIPAPRVYWSILEVAARGLAQPFDGDDAAACAMLDTELRRAVSQQTIADVPLGAFLSGGIDSTAVVALLQAQSTQRVRTFTVGFEESEFDEARHAAVVARHLGTEHAEMRVTAADALRVIPVLPTLYDEPLGDTSAIPTHLIAAFARRHVTVCLSGDGGDEMFGGYDRYGGTQRMWQRLRHVPGVLRTLAAAGCDALARAGSGSRAGWRAERMALYLAARDSDECYAAKTQQWPDAGALVVGAAEAPRRVAPAFTGSDLHARMMLMDGVTYLPDDILAKVDRAAMAVSLETRIPLLDARIVEFAWSLPQRMKVRDGRTKWLLRRLVSRYVPEALMERPKMGFGIPVGAWLRGPLRGWAESLLDAERLRREGFFAPAPVRARWLAHLSGSRDAVDSLWPILMFQAWLADAATQA